MINIRANLPLLVGGMAFLALSVSCDIQNISNMPENPDNEKVTTQKAKSGVLYKLSFDQTTASYSTRIPAGLEIPEGTDKFILRNYEKVKRTITMDGNGYINITTEWPDGHADMNMPVEWYRRMSHLRPAAGEGYDHVVRSEMSDGFIRYFSKDGKVLHEYALDEAHFKIDPALVRERLKSLHEGKGISEQVSQNLAALQQQGINFRQLNANYAELSHPAEEGSEIIHQKQLLDLRLGRVIRSFDIRSDGRVLNREYMHYKETNSLPVLRNSLTERFGERNGKWVMTDRTVVSRENIEIFVH